MTAQDSEKQGQTLLNAVERILDPTHKIVELVEEHSRKTPQYQGLSRESWRREVGEQLIRVYSNKSAVSGGLTALPGIVPGVGTLLAALGGTMADMVMVLKFEVEMSLALTHLYGFDIRLQNERQLAFLLASVQTYEAKSGRSLVSELGETATTAVWNYTPREVSKRLLKVMTMIALLNISKGFLRAVPLVGIAVGSGVNKVLTTKVGESCVRHLALRRKQAGPG